MLPCKFYDIISKKVIIMSDNEKKFYELSEKEQKDKLMSLE